MRATIGGDTDAADPLGRVRNLEIANVFAGPFSVILIGLVVENVIFRNIEQRTVRRWGMQGQ